MPWDSTTTPRPSPGRVFTRFGADVFVGTGGLGSSSGAGSTGSGTFQVFTADLGPIGFLAGSFVISDLSGLVEGAKVLVWADTEGDVVTASGVVTSETEITVQWQATSPMRGAVIFNYVIGG